MKKLNWKYYLLNWLRNKVFRLKEGEPIPKILQYIYCILNPTLCLCKNQNELRYDIEKNIIIIFGVKYSAEMFKSFAVRDGFVFNFKKNKDDIIFTVKKEPEKIEDMILDYDEWLSKFENSVYNEFLEIGLPRELDFDIEYELQKRYKQYINKIIDLCLSKIN